MIEERLMICYACEEISLIKPKEKRNPKWVDRIDVYCDQCGCNIEAKTGCLDNDAGCECPLQKWMRYNKDKNKENG